MRPFLACVRISLGARHAARSMRAFWPLSPENLEESETDGGQTPTFSLTVIPSATEPLAVPSWVE